MDRYRTMLFAPATKPDIVGKALASPADATIIDLEDAVAIGAKETARNNIAVILADSSATTGKVYVRINSWGGAWGRADLQALLSLPIDGIMLPKAEDPAVIHAVAKTLPSHMDLIPLIETAKGVLNAFAIASENRVSRLAFGAVDFTLDIGVTLSGTGEELQYARSALVVASRAADIAPPIDTVYPDFKDREGYRRELMQIKRIGMFGKLIIHPAQIEAANEVFSPTPDEIEYAERVVRTFEEAERQGFAAVQVDGRMIDYPVVASCRRILALSGKPTASACEDT